MKKVLSVLCMLCLIVGLAACKSTVIQPDDTGLAEGSVGDTLRAQMMDVKVVSAKKVSSYGDYTPISGDSLVNTVMYIENTSEEPITLLDTSFQIQWGEQGFAEPLPALYDSTLAPMSMVLQPGESSEYHYLFSVPSAVTILSVCFNDIDPATGEPAGEYFYKASFSL